MSISKNKIIGIKQEEWGQASALRIHLGNLLETVYVFSDKGLTGKQPLQIDSGQVLLAVASLRALLPLLLSFLRKNELELVVNSFKGDFAMLFYAQTRPEEECLLAHFLLSFIVGEKEQDEVQAKSYK